MVRHLTEDMFEAKPDIRFPKVKFCNSVVGRTTRKSALKTIFTELGVTTFRERRATLRKLYRPLSFYVHWSKQKLPSTDEVNAWTSAAHTHARKLVELLGSIPVPQWVDIMYPDQPLFIGADKAGLIEDLRSIEATTTRRVVGRKGKRMSQPRIALGPLISSLDALFTTTTGNEGGVWRHSYGSYQGQPDSPFFRLARAAVTLVAVKVSDEQLFDAIQEHKKMRDVAKARYSNLHT